MDGQTDGWTNGQVIHEAAIVQEDTILFYSSILVHALIKSKSSSKIFCYRKLCTLYLLFAVVMVFTDSVRYCVYTVQVDRGLGRTTTVATISFTIAWGILEYCQNPNHNPNTTQYNLNCSWV